MVIVHIQSRAALADLTPSYNQDTHECIVNFVNTDFDPDSQTIPWQRLETILSVYIDMIESKKVVCIHDDVERVGDSKLMDLGGEAGQQWLTTQDRPNALLADPTTEIVRNEHVMFGNWIVQPYTKEVLDQCLQNLGSSDRNHRTQDARDFEEWWGSPVWSGD